MSSQNQELTKAQSAAIAEQLAGFFFDFWNKKNSGGYAETNQRNLLLNNDYAKQTTQQKVIRN